MKGLLAFPSDGEEDEEEERPLLNRMRAGTINMLGGIQKAVLKNVMENIALRQEFDKDRSMQIMQRQTSVFHNEFRGIDLDYDEMQERRGTVVQPDFAVLN